MKYKPLTALIIASALLPMPYGVAQTQQIYKWIDANGQVHYSQREPDSSAQAQKLDIAPPPADSSSSNADAAAEVARINALADQMARERQEAEKVRQEQAARNLEQENQQLQNELLKQQAEQQKQNQENDSNRAIIGYPPPYPYPSYPLPHRPKPDRGPPCQPWPECRQPITPPVRPQPPPAPLAKPNPPFRPAPAGIDPASQGIFSGR